MAMSMTAMPAEVDDEELPGLSYQGRLFTAAQAARILQVTAETVREMCASRLLPAMRFPGPSGRGRQWRIAESDLEEFLTKLYVNRPEADG